MKGRPSLGLTSCRIASYHTQWRATETEEQTQRVRGDTDREAEKTEIIMSKAAVKSDLVHHDVRVGSIGGDGCEEVSEKGSILTGNER